MQIKILKEIKGAWHTLKEGEIYTLPYLLEDKKTKHKMSLQYIEVDNDIFKDGFCVSFSSSSHSAKDGYAGSGGALHFNKHFVFCENPSASKSIDTKQGSLF